MKTKKFRQLLVLTGLLMLLAACASQPAYRAADGNGLGYSERQLTEDQYRIHFRGRGDNTGRAMDYAMLRATELTLEKGFDWFDVASRDTLVDRESVPVSTTSAVGVSYATVQDCGLLTCSTYYRPVPQYQTTTTMGNQRRKVEVIMEIRMGKGMRPSGQTSYDARELYSRLKPEA
jgi:hypothetical protein